MDLQRGWRGRMDEAECWGETSGEEKVERTWRGWIKIVEDGGQRHDIEAIPLICD